MSLTLPGATEGAVESLPTGPVPSPTSTPTPTPTSSPARRRRLPRWTREPLLHFLLLGGLLFGLDHLLVSREDDPSVIVVGRDVDEEAIATFSASRGRVPTATELEALRRVWLDNEVLYREGLALQVDKGDTAIRERVIFKSLSVVDAGVKLPPVTDDTLRAWFNSHRDKYDDPARFDFEEAVMDSGATEAELRGFVKALNAGTPGDARAGLRIFKGRPHANLVQSYGEVFAQALETAPVGEWRLQRTREGGQDGWRIMRLNAAMPARPGHFESLRGVVLQDWTDATLSEQRSAAVKALSGKYTLRFEGAR